MMNVVVCPTPDFLRGVMLISDELDIFCVNELGPALTGRRTKFSWRGSSFCSKNVTLSQCYPN